MIKKLVTRKDDYSQWYNDLVAMAGLAEHAAVRGCMVIKPYGYAIWEKMQSVLDTRFKETGHSNAYFPLLIPKSFFSKEASHVEGFAKECAVVTHYRLKNDSDGNIVVDEEARLEEELIIRPTSETIIWNTFKGWVESYRDLPLLINQWANVMRWEMRTRLFLRTSEFLWQEGHTAHVSALEAEQEAKRMLEVYAEFAEQWMALPVIKGTKTANERFAGAVDTYCIEALMQDGKSLQAGTSHFLGQNFAKAFDVRFTSKEGRLEYVWATSWGVSTRLMGALVMAHSDDQGLVIPPKLAPIQVIIITITRSDDPSDLLDTAVESLLRELATSGVRAQADTRDLRPGQKFAEWELKGVPVRIAIGTRDLATGELEVARRDTQSKFKLVKTGIAPAITQLLEDIQAQMYQRALHFRDGHITRCDTFQQFVQVLDEKGGYISAHWDGTTETELAIKEQTKATIRCIPLGANLEEGRCIYTGNPSKQRVLFARAY